jgi:hypothetical protein
MLQITEAGRNRIVSDQSINETYEFVRMIAVRPEPIVWQLFLVRTARILTSTENDPVVSDADIMEFIHENELLFMEVCRAVREAIQLHDRRKQVH